MTLKVPSEYGNILVSSEYSSILLEHKHTDNHQVSSML